MNRLRLVECVVSPEKLVADDYADLKDLISAYPYFQAGRILMTKALRIGNDVRFFEELKNMALYSGDRSHLYDLLNSNAEAIPAKQILASDPKFSEPEPDKNQVLESQEEPQKKPLRDFFDSVPEITEQKLIQQITLYPELYAPEKIFDDNEIKKIREEPLQPITLGFFEWLENLNMRRKNNTSADISVSEITRQEKNATDVGQKTPSEIIEQFILSEPRITQPEKHAFFSPSMMAKKSVEDQNEIVSETLAKVHADQGNFQKAIEIYRQLILLYPEKNTYFAAFIEKLTNNP